MTEQKLLNDETVEELLEESRKWNIYSVVITLLIVFSTLISTSRSESGTLAALLSTQFVSKNDLIVWFVAPLVHQSGIQLENPGLLQQAYDLALRLEGVPENERNKRLSEVQTVEGYRQKLPKDIIERANNVVESLKSTAHFYDRVQIFLAGILVLCQLFALNASNKLTKILTKRNTSSS